MTLAAVDSDPVAARLSLIRPHLDERAWRLLLGAEGKGLGRGGGKLVAVAGGGGEGVGWGGNKVGGGGGGGASESGGGGGAGFGLRETIPGGGARAGWGAPADGGDRSRSGRRARRAGGSDLARRSGVTVAVDDQIDGEVGRPADRHGASGVCADGGQAAQTGWLQPAGELENP